MSAEGPPAAFRREAIDAWLLNKRSSEEVKSIKKEMLDIITCYKKQLDVAHDQELALRKQENDFSVKYLAGLHQLLQKKKNEIQLILQNCQTTFQRHSELSQSQPDPDTVDIDDYYFSDDDSDDDDDDDL